MDRLNFISYSVCNLDSGWSNPNGQSGQSDHGRFDPLAKFESSDAILEQVDEYDRQTRRGLGMEEETEEESSDEDDDEACDTLGSLQRKGMLNWKEFFGSSVDLAPTLMNIYDNYATASKSVTFAPDITSQSPDDQHGPSVTMDTALAKDTGDSPPPGGGVGNHHGNHPPLFISDNDAKKRPLSVSSTASSSSSTSSLPRHQRKKVATSVTTATTSLATSYSGEDGGDNGGDALMEISFVEEEEGSRVAMDTSLGSPQPSSKHGNDTRINQSRLHQGNGRAWDLNRSISDPTHNHVISHVSGSRSGRHDHHIGLSYIDKVVHEIIETERTYVTDLQDIIEGYLHHFRDAPDLPMSTDDLNSLFANIEDIYDFNKEFLSQIEQCGNNPVSIAQCFVDMNSGFVIYTGYCTNYPKCVEVLTKCMRDKETAESFKDQQIALRHGLPLGSFLLKPVQRILKYHLLLQNILNNFDKSAGGYDTISEALNSMTSMAQHINEMKRKHEHTVRIQEIQSILYGWEGADLTTFGDLVLEDTFRMSGAKGSRHLFLFEKAILLAKKKEDNTLIVKAYIMCSNLMLIESVPKEPLSFHLIPFDNPRMQYTIQAKNLEHKRQWCAEIKRKILDNFNVAIPDKAKELVMKLGKSKEEEDFDDRNADSIEPRKQHTAPEYLEKRMRRRRSTSFIPDFGILKGKRTPKKSPRERRKSEFVSYVASSQAPETEDVQEEPNEDECQPESPSPSTTPSGGLFDRGGHSRSLESLTDLCGTDSSAGSSKRQSIIEPETGSMSYDDACPRANRMSRILAEESLEAQLCDGRSHVGWDEKIVNSVLEVSPVRRAESYRLANCAINRIDSVNIRSQSSSRDYIDSNHCHKSNDAISGDKSNDKTLERSNTSPCILEPNYENVDYNHVCDNSEKVHELDDGYVNVTFPPKIEKADDKTPALNELQSSLRHLCSESSTDDCLNNANNDGAVNLKNVLISQQGSAVNNKPPTGVSNKRENTVIPVKIYRSYSRQNSNSSDCGPKSPLSPSSQSAANVFNASDSGRTTPVANRANGRTSVGNSPKLRLAHSASPVRNSPTKKVGSSPSGRATPVSGRATPVSGRATPVINKQTSPSNNGGGNCDTGIYDNWQVGATNNNNCTDVSDVGVYDNIVYSPRLSRDSTNSHSSTDTVNSKPIPKPKPKPLTVKIPQNKQKTFLSGLVSPKVAPVNSSSPEMVVDPWVPLTREHMVAERSSVVRQNSMNECDESYKAKMKRLSRMFRSNSFSSVDDADDPTDLAKTDTLVFANRSPYLASKTEHSVKISPMLQRAIDRLATPPRELGPQEVVKEVDKGTENGKVALRYATPPRASPDDKPSTNEDTFNIENTYTCELQKEILDAIENIEQGINLKQQNFYASPTHENHMRPKISESVHSSNVGRAVSMSVGDSPSIWHDTDDEVDVDYHHRNESPASPRQPQRQSRPGSFHGATVYSTRETPSSASKSTPSSAHVLSSDSIVDSFKNAVMNLTSKITGRHPRSNDNSPVKAPRARSVGEVERNRVNMNGESICKSPTTKDGKQKETNKRNKYVYKLARAYSERMKGQRIPVEKRSKSTDPHEDEDMQTGPKSSQELKSLLKENEQGSSCIGERIAVTKPVVLGTYTLPRHKKYKRKQNADNSNDSDVMDETPPEVPSSYIYSNSRVDPEEVARLHQNDHLLEYPVDNIDGAYDNLNQNCPFMKPSDCMVTSDPDNVSLDSYYERRFMEDLETGIYDGILGDPDLNSDVTNLPSSPKLSIRQTMKIMEHRLKSKPIPKIEIKRDEKAQGVQNIVRTLEATRGPTGCDHPVDDLPKPTAYRSRELFECAMMTRIRKNSLGEDTHHLTPAEEEKLGVIAAGPDTIPKIGPES